MDSKKETCTVSISNMDSPRQHFLSGKRIIIAGGGIAGLSFAASLNQLWHSALGPPPIITIFDRDAQDVDQQREGYSLSLAGHDNTGGLIALKNMNLLDRICSHAISGLDDKGSFKIWTSDWKEKISLRRKPVDGLPSSSIRVTRRDLRQVLLSAIGTSVSVQWQSKCLSAASNADGGVTVQVQKEGQEQAETYGCDLLIVADGANSKLRSFLRPDDKLQYAGAVLRGGLSRFDGPLPKPLDRDWGFVLSGTGVSCFYSPVDDNSIVWAVGHLEEDESPAFNRESEDEAAAVISRARELGADFAEPFSTVVSQTDHRAVMCINAKDKMPFSHQESINKMPAIFIGDSNHALSPFAGFGANLALADGWELAHQLCSGRDIAAAVRRYDAVAVPRAARIVKASRAKLRTGHSTGWRLWMFMVMLAVGRFFGMVLRRR